jgi:tetratricopeptide (TPR) repeat protein
MLADITFSLCRSRRYQVIAPYTARQLADDATAEAHEVEIDYRVISRLLESRTPQGYPRLSVDLAPTDRSGSLYYDELELVPGTLLDLHFALSATVADRISGQIAREELLRFRRTGAASAYVHYLIAMEHSDRNDLASILRSQKSLKRSVQLSPDYAPALSQLARTMTLEWLERGVQDRHLLIEAQRLARRAQSYDPGDSGSLREFGHAALYLHDLDTALDCYEKAAISAPNHADLLADHADALAHASRFEEAEAKIVRALELNPLAPDDYYWVGGAVSFFRGRYEEGLRRLTTMRSPGQAVRLMAACAAMNGDLEAAGAYRDLAIERDPVFRVDNWTSLYPQRDKRDAEHYLHALRLAGFR